MLHLDPDIRDAITRHAGATAPAECCGGLLGVRDIAGARRIRLAVRVPNRHETPTRAFLLGARDVLRLERLAAARGLELLGFYHSHPDGPAEPSATDLDAAWPWYTQLIVGDDGVRAWRLRPDRSGFDREAIA